MEEPRAGVVVAYAERKAHGPGDPLGHPHGGHELPSRRLGHHGRRACSLTAAFATDGRVAQQLGEDFRAWREGELRGRREGDEIAQLRTTRDADNGVTDIHMVVEAAESLARDEKAAEVGLASADERVSRRGNLGLRGNGESRHPRRLRTHEPEGRQLDVTESRGMSTGLWPNRGVRDRFDDKLESAGGEEFEGERDRRFAALVGGLEFDAGTHFAIALGVGPRLFRLEQLAPQRQWGGNQQPCAEERCAAWCEPPDLRIMVSTPCAGAGCLTKTGQTG